MITYMTSPVKTVTSRKNECPAYSRLLVPLDGSKLAEAALPAAIALVRRAGGNGAVVLGRVGPMGSIVYAHGTYFEVPGEAQKEMQTYLEKVAEIVRTEHIPVELACAEGDPVTGIADMAHDHHVDLIVMVTHSREGLSRLFHRSVANRVLRETPVPVLLLKQDEQAESIFSFEEHPHLLVPLDGTENSAAIASRAITLAHQLGASVTVMRSLDLPDLALTDKSSAGTTTDAIRATIPADRNRAAQYLSKMQGLFLSREIPTDIALTEGGAARDIVAQAQALKDTGKQVIIVMATSGHTGVQRLLFGSVTGTVLHLAEAPLLVIRPQ